MKDSRPVLDGDIGELERAVLRSAAADAPSDEARRRTAIALGIAGGIAAGTAAGTASAAAGVSKWGALGLSSAVKWIGLSAVTAGLVTAGVVEYEATRDAKSVATPAAATAAMPPRLSPASTSKRSTEAPRVEPPAADISAAATPPLPPAPLATDRARSRGPSIAPADAPSAGSPLSREVALLDRARSAMDSHDARSALAALDEYARAFPQGALRPEADVLRIEALAASGDADGARRRARQFLQQQPTSPQAQRVRTLLEGLETKP